MRHFNLNRHAALMASVALVMVGLPMQAASQDQRIETSALNSYNFKTYLKDDAIKVSSSEGVVTLTGTVSRDFHRALAEDTVAGLPGVKTVVNKLMVVGEQPSENSDAWMTMKVKGVLAFHKNVSASDTEVTTEKGIVTLTGKADSESQKQLTTEYAKDVEGVLEVRNNTVVHAQAHRSLGTKVDDSSITAQVKTSLLFHKSTHAMATKVTTKNGAVTLRGEAKNSAERDLVTKLVEDIEGVKHVSNKMTVK
ncbi:MAG: BON domain-containing protein [Holophagaceae bacterium]|uniref:BON domain-containing protein n=1 Tax=Candidatus Geothrix skivensis TaxID=2954439 RepID=A0A9D7SJ02_9BACT|nr:BON domain-containing protein [Candidatus Geothrix skivensis]